MVFLVNKFLVRGISCRYIFGSWWLVVGRGGSWWLVVACGGSCVVLETTIKMSPRFVLGRENVPCVAEVVNRSLKADCTDFIHDDPLALRYT